MSDECEKCGYEGFVKHICKNVDSLVVLHVKVLIHSLTMKYLMSFTFHGFIIFHNHILPQKVVIS